MLKSAVTAAGIEEESVLLLLEEHHLKDESLAVTVNGIICRGDVPSLYSTDELDKLLSPLAESARRSNFQGSIEQYFYHRKSIQLGFSNKRNGGEIFSLQGSKEI